MVGFVDRFCGFEREELNTSAQLSVINLIAGIIYNAFVTILKAAVRYSRRSLVVRVVGISRATMKFVGIEQSEHVRTSCALLKRTASVFCPPCSGQFSFVTYYAHVFLDE